MTEECSTCRFFKVEVKDECPQDSLGLCRRFPPTIAMNMYEHDDVDANKIAWASRQPSCFGAYWCGEFKPKVEERDDD